MNVLTRIKRFLCPSPWTYGTHGTLKARRHKNGKVEIFAPRSNPEHALWIETHKEHWPKFKPHTKENGNIK